MLSEAVAMAQGGGGQGSGRGVGDKRAEVGPGAESWRMASSFLLIEGAGWGGEGTRSVRCSWNTVQEWGVRRAFWTEPVDVVRGRELTLEKSGDHGRGDAL